MLKRIQHRVVCNIDHTNSLDGLLQHVVAVPAGDGNESDSLGVVTDLLDEGGGLLHDFVEAVLAPL